MQILCPEDWKPPIGYSNGIKAPNGNLIFVAGQVGWNEKQIFESEDLVPQFEQALKNVLAVVISGGGKSHNICRITAFCTSKPEYLAARPQLGEIWRNLMGKHFPGHEHDFCFLIYLIIQAK